MSCEGSHSVVMLYRTARLNMMLLF